MCITLSISLLPLPHYYILVKIDEEYAKNLQSHFFMNVKYTSNGHISNSVFIQQLTNSKGLLSSSQHEQTK